MFTQAQTLTLNQITCREDNPTWLSARLFPFRRRFCQIGPVRFHYVDEGSGRPLLLLHGSPMWSMMYRTTIAELRAKYRVIAVDLPGMGLSRAPVCFGQAFSRSAGWLQRLVQRLDLGETTLVVHATAGPPGLEMAIRERNRFRNLVVSNSFAWPLQDVPELAGIVRIVSSRPFGWFNSTFNLLPRLTAIGARRTGQFTKAERAGILGPYENVATRDHLSSFLRSIRTEAKFLSRLEERLSALQDMPTLMLFGARDNGYRAGTMNRFRKLLPRHVCRVLPHAGHFPLEDAPTEFNAHLSAWLTSDAHNDE